MSAGERFCPPWPTVSAYPPKHLGPILVLQEKWWQLIVAGKKNLEMRHEALTPLVKRHVGRGGELWGTVTLGKAFEVKTDEEWRALRPRHQVDKSTRMHEKEMAHPIAAVEVFDTSIHYEPLRGQVGTARYRAPGSGKATAGTRQGAAKRPAATAPTPVRKRPRWARGALQQAAGAAAALAEGPRADADAAM